MRCASRSWARARSPPSATRPPPCIMVETGNGHRLSSSTSDPAACATSLPMRFRYQTINDIFVTHLHVDHYGKLPYLYDVRALVGTVDAAARARPVRPQEERGYRPHDRGHEGDDHLAHQGVLRGARRAEGYEVEGQRVRLRGRQRDLLTTTTASPFATGGGWRTTWTARTAYRLDWNGLSFVWTGDG